MILKDALLTTYDKSSASRIVKHIGNDPERFQELITAFLAGPYRITQRASWFLSKAVEQNPLLVKPHVRALVAYLEKPDLPDAVKRNILRLFQFITIPKNLQGRVADRCFTFLRSEEPVAIKVFAMTALGEIAFQHPHLKKEVCMMIEDQLEFSSAAYRSRARKVLKRLSDPPHK